MTSASITPPLYTAAPPTDTDAPPLHTAAPPTYTDAPPLHTAAPPPYTAAPPPLTARPSAGRPSPSTVRTASCARAIARTLAHASLSLLLLAPVFGPAPLWAQETLRWTDIADVRAPAPDHRIAYGTDSLQFGHLRLPEAPGPHPVIVFMHGGCWLSDYDIAHVGPLEEALREEGWAVWSLEYRRAGDEGGGWPGTFLDVAAGADHLRNLAKEHPLDLERVIASGHSAGGQLALWLAARSRLPESSRLHTPDPIPVAGVLALAPAAAMGALHESGACGNAMGRLMGGGPREHPDRYDAVSPLRLIPAEVPQRLLIGALDSAWAPPGRAYQHVAETAGLAPVSATELPESGHFEMIVPWSSSWTLVIEELRALTAEIDGSEGR